MDYLKDLVGKYAALSPKSRLSADTLIYGIPAVLLGMLGAFGLYVVWVILVLALQFWVTYTSK